MTSERGRIAVIEGSDSSGKEVQPKKLVEVLREKGYLVSFLDFPRYDEFFGKLVGRYLAGEFGDSQEVSPWLSALPYSLDRFEKKEEVAKWIAQGRILVCNRYIGSNLAFMSAKLPENERPIFIEWLEELEYKRLGVPMEDISVFLHVPAKIGQILTYKKDEKVYMKGKGRGDIHERNLPYLEEVIKQYFWLAENRKRFALVECMADDENLRPKEEIHQEILETLRERAII